MLIEHWIWCNLYPKHKKNVIGAILKLYDEFKLKVRYPKQKQTEKWKEGSAKSFTLSLQKGFDIKAQDKQYIKKQEELYGVKETEVEHEFLVDQVQGERKMYYESFVDRKWRSLHERKQKEKEGFEKLKQRQEEQIESMRKVPMPKDLEEELMSVDEEDEKADSESDYVVEEEDESGKRKRQLVKETDDKGQGNTLPEGWQHIRSSIWKVGNKFISLYFIRGHYFHLPLPPFRGWRGVKSITFIYFRCAMSITGALTAWCQSCT